MGFAITAVVAPKAVRTVMTTSLCGSTHPTECWLLPGLGEELEVWFPEG